MKSIFRVITLIWFTAYPLWSQQEKITRDIGVWASFGANYKINKKWKVLIIQEIRSFDNAIKLQQYITDLGLTYRINNQFKLGGMLRYTYDRKKDYTFSNDIRYNIDFKFKSKRRNKFNLFYRFRFQHSYLNLFTYITDIDQKSNARNRIKIQYSVKQHAVYFAAELFREYVIYQKPTFNSLRASLGDETKILSGDFKYSLAYERELNQQNPLNFFFLKLNYTFNFKHD